MKVLELFAGIGACSKALERLGIEHEIVDAVEIDKYAIGSFNAVHGTNFEPQDITTWDKDIECDLIMHGSPCQDFSSAGLQAGGDKGSGTRSSLMYETLRIVEKLRPKYVVWENVKNLLSKKHRHNFDAYQEAMKELGYNSHYQVLNAKDYGVPQNRERVFTVSIRNDIEDTFVFPEKQELTVKLKDVLETDVDGKYYLSDEQVASFKADSDNQTAKGYGFVFRPRSTETYALTISTRAGQRKTDNFIEEETVWRAVARTAYSRNFGSKGKLQNTDGAAQTLQAGMGEGGGNVPLVSVKTMRGEDIASTIRASIHKQGARNLLENIKNGRCYEGVAIRTNDSQGMLDGYRIRKLTPRECWRLMGFDDSDFNKAQAIGTSNTQLYKQAGNSIVVDVLYNIFKELLQ